jgi:diguanylate cyclase (GGDEF)-like protein
MSRPGLDHVSVDVINEVTRIATLDLALRPMLQRVADTLRQRCGWEFVACVSLDQKNQRFVCEAVSTDLPTAIHAGYSRPLGSGVVGAVAASGQPVALDDVTHFPGYVETLPGARSELCVPVRHQGATIALLNLESLRPGAFRGQVPLLERVADQLSGVIANAQIYDEVRRRARLLEMVSEASRVALEAEPDSVLHGIVAFIHDRFPLSTVAILLVDEEAGTFEQSAHVGGVQRRVPTGTRWDYHKGIVGRAIQTREPQIVRDVSRDPDYLEVDSSVTSECAIPIVLGGRVLGVLNLESYSPDVFNEDSLAAFRAIADQLAGAIRMASVNQELAETNQKLRRANRRLARLSSIDGLTGVANRRRFDARLASEWRRSRRTGTPLSLIMSDIDCFKDYNDCHGHQAGDETLRRVAHELRHSLHRVGDLLARYGGEEFAALLPTTDLAQALRVAEVLRSRVQALAIPHGASAVGVVVTISAGVATLDPRAGEADVQALVAQADQALYLAKRDGRNRVCALPEAHPATRTTPKPHP